MKRALAAIAAVVTFGAPTLSSCTPAPAGPQPAAKMSEATARKWTTNANRDNLPASQPYGYAVRPLDVNTAEQMRGWLWNSNCPVRWEDLSIVTVIYRGFDGKSHTGRIIAHDSVAPKLGFALGMLYQGGFRVYQMDFMNTLATTQYPDLPSNNTYSFHCRNTTGGSTWSQHAYGKAIDLNPVENPYFKQSTGYVFPPAGSQYIIRIPLKTGMIGPNSLTETAFYRIGWTWGGRWSSIKDWMHFSESGR